MLFIPFSFRSNKGADKIPALNAGPVSSSHYLADHLPLFVYYKMHGVRSNSIIPGNTSIGVQQYWKGHFLFFHKFFYNFTLLPDIYTQNNQAAFLELIV